MSANVAVAHKQTIMDGVDGNCLQAAVATALGLRLEQVPNFTLFRSWWFDALMNWCTENGYEIAPGYPDHLPDEKMLAFGRSSRGLRHAVVWQGHNMLHDPHPDGSGLVSVDEFWWISAATSEPTGADS